MSHVAEDASHGSRVASQLVGNDPQWFGTLAMQEFSKESFCGALITMSAGPEVVETELLTPLPDRFIGHDETSSKYQ